MASLRTLRITRRAADRLRSGHLWIYRTEIEGEPSAAFQAAGQGDRENRDPEPGSLVTVVDAREIPLGTALYSSTSQIAARLVSRTPALTREQYLAELRERVDAALRLRRELAPVTESSNAHRLIFAEADNLPGIVADRYNDLVVLQLLTQGTAQDDVRCVVVDALRDAFASEGHALTLWERTDPRIRELEQLPPPPAGALFTTSADSIAPDGLSFRTGAERDADLAAPATTVFTLNGLRFHYDAASGQKTGAFLDQRLNYAAAARAVQASSRRAQASARGLRALDVCTYQGGFALHLAQVCEFVTGVDASRSALEAADRNLALNPSLRSEVEWMEADAFEYLRHLDDLARTHPNYVHSTAGGPARTPVISTEGGAFAAEVERPAAKTANNPHLFDAIVLDPPAFAKSKRAAEGALRGYKELNLRAIRLLAPGGILITNSCSHHISLEEFTAIVASAAADAGRRVQLLEIRAAAPDHPEVLTLPETRYLKCLICRVE